MIIEKQVLADGVVILRLRGKLNTTFAGKLQTGVEEALGQGQINIILNCRGVTTIDAGGTGKIMKALADVSSAGGSLYLVDLSPSVSQMLKITKVVSQLPVFGKEEQAVEELRGPKISSQVEESLEGRNPFEP